MSKLIFIDKTFFSLQLPQSEGLISGLKKLNERGFSFSTDFDFSSNPTLKNILTAEQINFINESKDYSYIISAKQKENENEFFLSDELKSFADIAEKILTQLRTAKRHRKTKETDIKISVVLDGSGKSEINTGIGFFDHMLEQVARHGNINLKVAVKGDLHIDEHHTVEDVGIALGEVLLEALGDKKGIKRYGYLLPMDDSTAKCAIDLGGRTYLNFKCKFGREMVGEFPTELTEEFFRGLASGLKANIYLRAKGNNDHHKIEAMFKAFAKSLNEACRFDERSSGTLPSTKGVL